MNVVLEGIKMNNIRNDLTNLLKRLQNKTAVNKTKTTKTTKENTKK